MRLPLDTTDEVDEDPTGNKALWDRGLLNGASQKVGVQYTEFRMRGVFPLVTLSAVPDLDYVLSVC